MKTSIKTAATITLALALAAMPACPAPAAEQTAQQTEKNEKADPPKNLPADNSKKDAAQNSDQKDASPSRETDVPADYSCKYYSVKLPDNWKAILPPTEQQGTINAIFAKKSGSPIVTLVIGPTGGADLETIANMFAEQFKASKPPVKKNDQYTFSYRIQDATAQAFVAGFEKDFMFAYIVGNMKEARNFISKNIRSENYSALLPQ